jgi:hypothetical protein
LHIDNHQPTLRWIYLNRILPDTIRANIRLDSYRTASVYTSSKIDTGGRFFDPVIVKVSPGVGEGGVSGRALGEDDNGKGEEEREGRK